MFPVRRLSLAASLLAVPLLVTAPVRAATTPSHVKASLVAADTSIQPGKPITVALRFVHDPHWHTYWIQPGTGRATTLVWELPAGWKAGDIQWPAPRLVIDLRDTRSNGYEGEVFLPVTLTPPANLQPGDRVELKALSEWLMCGEGVCMPGKAEVTLTLTVAAGAPQPDPQWGGKIRATVAGLPRPDPLWKISASHDQSTVTITATPSNAGSTAPEKPHFFSEDGYIAYDQPQQVTPDGKGGFTLVAPISEDAERGTKILHGVLTSESGWLPGSELRGLRVDVALVSAASGGLIGTLALAFVGGLILNLMPCVFPVLGIKILGFVNQAGHDRKKIVAHGLVFTLGVLLSFWTLAGALAALRAGGDQLGWGFQLQSPVFVYALAILLLVFAMNMSGVFEFGLGATAVGGNLQTKSGYAGSFFTGVLATVVATPCSAPFLAPALGAALAVSPVESFAIFTAIAIGLSTPYLLLSIFPQAVKILPRPGGWMETFKQLMAFPLYATVGALIWVLTGQIKDDSLLAILGLVVVALGVWIYGRWTAPGASTGRVRFGQAGVLACLVFGLWLGWPHAPKIDWQDWSPETVTKLRAEGKTIYVDFTARWCATCQTNKKLVFSSDEVLEYIKAKNIVTLRGDWTNNDPRITAELARYGRSAVPFNVIWMPGKEAPVILPELLTPGTVLEALKKG